MLPLYDPTKETSVLAYAYPEQSNGLCLCFLSPHKYEVRYIQTESLWQQHEPISTYVNISSEKEFYLETDHKPLVISPELLALPKYREVLYTESYQKNLTNYAVVEVHCMLTWYTSHWWCMQSAVAIQCSSGYNVSKENFLIYLFVGQTFESTSNVWVKFEL